MLILTVTLTQMQTQASSVNKVLRTQCERNIKPIICDKQITVANVHWEQSSEENFIFNYLYYKRIAIVTAFAQLITNETMPLDHYGPILCLFAKYP